jgi:hypothetical protein
MYGDGMNPYLAFAANPITGRDPSGLLTDPFADTDAVIAQRQAAAFAAIARFNLIARQTVIMAGRIAFQGAITAIVPGAALYFTAKGLAETIEDVAQRGLTLGNVAMGVFDVVNLPFDARAAFRGSKQLIRAVKNFNARHIELQIKQRENALGKVERHHPIPKFLGGDIQQILVDVPSALHQHYHRLLSVELKARGITRPIGGRGGSKDDWAQHFTDNPGTQTEAFNAVIDSARNFDYMYGTDILEAVWKNFSTGSYK